MEKQIVAAILQDRDSYSRIESLLARSGVLSDQYQLIFNEAQAYYENDSAAMYVDTAWLISRMERKYPKHADLFAEILRKLPEVSAINIVDEFIELRKSRLGEQLAEALLLGSDNVADLIEQYREADNLEEESKDSEVYEGVSVRELSTIYDPANLVPLHPPSLNTAIGGGLPLGGHVIIYARPELGKSAFGINLGAACAHAGYRTLYFGNEDPAKFMLLRYISRFTGMSKAQILSDPDHADQVAIERGYSNLRFVSLAPGGIEDIRKHILDYKPKICIIDQLTNLKCGDKSKSEKFEELAYRVRMLFKETGVAGVSFCQAGESADGKLILDMEDVYFSKTGVAAQADLMIGIGANGDFMNLGRRMLALPKNKLSGNHEAIPVAIDPVHSRYKDV